jgi:hypothetical protein
MFQPACEDDQSLNVGMRESEAPTIWEFALIVGGSATLVMRASDGLVAHSSTPHVGKQ